MSAMSEVGEQVAALDAGALFSPCRRWRYLLWRRWEPEQPVCMFVGLNPSTADETIDDPTVRRCIGFAKRWGYGSLHMLNLFAYRATDPNAMKVQEGAAVGPRNDEYLTQAGRRAGLVVAAWGVHGAFRERDTQVRRAMAGANVRLFVLRLTKHGHPQHPLYLPGDLTPVEWALFGGR